MIAKEIEAKSLAEYYQKLCKLQAGKHGDDYLLVHKEIRKRLENCFSYTEFGIKQGATLAVPMLEHPMKVRAYDNDLTWYNKASHLFETYAELCGIDFKVHERSTLEFTIAPVDLLYIDTVHTYKQLSQELELHAFNVRKYIICHDTASSSGLRDAIKEHCARTEWYIAHDCRINVGFTTLTK